MTSDDIVVGHKTISAGYDNVDGPIYLSDLTPEARGALEAALVFAESTPPGAMADARPAFAMREAARAFSASIRRANAIDVGQSPPKLPP